MKLELNVGICFGQAGIVARHIPSILCDVVRILFGGHTVTGIDMISRRRASVQRPVFEVFRKELGVLIRMSELAIDKELNR